MTQDEKIALATEKVLAGKLHPFDSRREEDGSFTLLYMLDSEIRVAPCVINIVFDNDKD